MFGDSCPAALGTVYRRSYRYPCVDLYSLLNILNNFQVHTKSSVIMVKKCCVYGCSTNYLSEKKNVVVQKFLFSGFLKKKKTVRGGNKLYQIPI